MTERSAAAVAIADWGTTRLRIWLLDAGGAVLAERRSDDGLLSARPDGFSAVLERHLADMGAAAGLPVVICGMAGARQGWIEAPYVTVPASLGEIFDGAVPVAGVARDIRIVPGLARRGVEAPDVMRGEETQLAGAAGRLASGGHVVCMPGTHSKWVEIDEGVVTRFQTFMTGELFSLLSSQSILSHAVAGAGAVTPDAAFRQACADALSDAGAVASRLFRIRAATLLHGLEPDTAAATLSGLLIGAEIAAATRIVTLPRREIVLVASGAMRDLYEAALSVAGFSADIVDADEAVRNGLARAARHHGMLEAKGTAA